MKHSLFLIEPDDAAGDITSASLVNLRLPSVRPSPTNEQPQAVPFVYVEKTFALSVEAQAKLKPAQVRALLRAGKYLEDGNNLMNWFLREMGGWEALPESLGAILPAAYAAHEKALIDAAYECDVLRVNQLGAEYVQAIVRDLRTAWRRRPTTSAQSAEPESARRDNVLPMRQAA